MSPRPPDDYVHTAWLHLLRSCATIGACLLTLAALGALAGCGGGDAGDTAGAPCATAGDTSHAQGGSSTVGAHTLAVLAPGPTVQATAGGTVHLQIDLQHTQATHYPAALLRVQVQVWRSAPDGSQPSAVGAPITAQGAPASLPAASLLALPHMAAQDAPPPGRWLYHLRSTVQALDAAGAPTSALAEYRHTVQWQARSCALGA